MKIEKLEHNMAKFTIEVSVEDFDKAINKAYQNQKNKISIPGFRKGKVSRQVIEKMFGKNVFYEEAANICIPDALEKAYEESGENIVSAPKIEVLEIEAGKPFVFTAEVALKPEVTLGEYKGVEIEKVDTEVTDEDVNAEIENERKKQARQVTVDRAVKDGDIAVIDFEGFVDGEPLENGKEENFSVYVGSDKFYMPGFEKQLIGKKQGEECDIDVELPEDYYMKELAGKKVSFKCTVHEVKEEQLPEVDADFADDAGFDSVDKYKENVRKELGERKAKAAKSAREDAVIEAVIKNATIDIPEAMIETQQRQMVEEFAQNLQMQGTSIKDYYMYTRMTPDKFMEMVKPRAQQRIESTLVLEAVAKAENIEATDEEFEDKIKEMAEQYGYEYEKFKSIIPEAEKDELKKSISIQKAVDFLNENAKEK